MYTNPYTSNKGGRTYKPKGLRFGFLGLQEGGRQDGICMSLKKVKMRKNNGKCYLFGIY